MSNLFSRINIRNLEIKNRIVMPPMVCFGYSKTDGQVTEKNVKHYETRARNGVGLIIIEATAVNPHGRLANVQLGLWSDEHIEGFRKITEACHKFGAKVLVQIHHAGLMTPSNVSNDKVAPSDYQQADDDGSLIKARALTSDELHNIQADFVSAALRAQKAGIDGIELHGAHSYLISQFFSPLVNKRQDEYGGSVQNRARFATEIIHQVRENLGAAFVIGCRMGCNEPDLESSIKIAQELQNAGADLLHVSFGMKFPSKTPKDEQPQVPDDFHYNWIVYGGVQIKRNVHIPVIVVSGIKTPEQANYLIENDLADFTAVGKGLLADPEWAKKAQLNQEVKTCLSCKRCNWFGSSEMCPRNKEREG